MSSNRRPRSGRTAISSSGTNRCDCATAWSTCASASGAFPDCRRRSASSYRRAARPPATVRCGFGGPRHPFRCRVEGLDFLAEREAKLLPTAFRALVEARAGNGGDADGLDEMAGEGDVVGKTEGGDIGHDGGCPAGHEAPKSRGAKASKKRIPAVLIVLREGLVVRVRKPEGFRRRFLERSRRAHGQEIVHLANGVRELRRGHR